MLYVFRLWLRDLVLNAKKPAKSRRVDRRTRRPGALTLESLEPLIMPAFGQLPIAFEANQGQADSQVEFLARGPGYGIFLTPTDAAITLTQAPTAAAGEGPDAAPTATAAA